jgi:hypothetical protein
MYNHIYFCFFFLSHGGQAVETRETRRTRERKPTGSAAPAHLPHPQKKSRVPPAATTITAMISILAQVIPLRPSNHSRNRRGHPWLLWLIRFVFSWLGLRICAQERLLGFALGSVSMGGFVLHQRRAIYRSIAEADGSPYFYQVSIWLLPPSLQPSSRLLSELV